ncbi:hypothetical protein FCM35_KLT13495 [Carex littledalei]|uniref:Uncharacterized protein n=1 Tax=Carex littledalei TaxID=544730 RepID=A0A833QP01_9POAL|nr:hypothetical protein FCM35_KLT13495 [Carex littledalei]
MLSKYAANLKEAGVSDLKIEQSMSENFGILSIIDIQPTKLETLEAQIEGLEENLKELKKQKDDILPKLLGGASLEEVLKEEKEKFNPICEENSKHIEMVEQLLLEIQVALVGGFRLGYAGLSRFGLHARWVRLRLGRFGSSYV